MITKVAAIAFFVQVLLSPLADAAADPPKPKPRCTVTKLRQLNSAETRAYERSIEICKGWPQEAADRGLIPANGFAGKVHIDPHGAFRVDGTSSTDVYKEGGKRRNLGSETGTEVSGWCGLDAQQCNTLEPLEYDESIPHNCDDVSALYELLGKHVCCGMNSNSHEAAKLTIAFFLKFPKFFTTGTPEMLDVRCGTNFQELDSIRELLLEHQADYEDVPKNKCIHKHDGELVDTQQQFTFHVLQHGTEGVHLTGVISLGGVVLDTISWAMDAEHERAITAKTFYKLATGVSGMHEHPAAISQAPTRGIVMHFPLEILGKVIRSSKQRGDLWDLLRNSCSSAVYDVVRKAFSLVKGGSCKLEDLPVFYFPNNVFDSLLDAAEQSGRGRVLSTDELSHLMRQGLAFDHWSQTLN